MNKPVNDLEDPKLSDVLDNYVTFQYRGTTLTFTKKDKELFDKLPRKEKRKMATKMKDAINRGELRVANIRGKRIVVKNKQHGTDKKRNSETPTTRKHGPG